MRHSAYNPRAILLTTMYPQQQNLKKDTNFEAKLKLKIATRYLLGLSTVELHAQINLTTIKIKIADKKITFVLSDTDRHFSGPVSD